MAESDLDPIQRRLIDEAVEAGRVRVIAQGVSGLPEDGSTGGWRDTSGVRAQRERRGKALKAAKARELGEHDVGSDGANGAAHQAPEVANTTNKSETRRLRAAEKKRAILAEVRDRRRHQSAPVPLGKSKVLADDHPAAIAGRSIFLATVCDVNGDEDLLKDGAHNVKIGGDVSLGHLRSAQIYTLTLEERATCPRSCTHWNSCYGNSMQMSRRWKHGPDLERRLVQELARVCATGDQVLVRLHVLGDFYSTTYVHLWFEALARHPHLNVFGFTGWMPETAIGEAIADVRAVFGARFAMRHSGRTGPWGSFTIDFPTERKQLGDAVVCPEQRAAMSGRSGVYCGSCAVCWQTEHPIVFVEH
ncbi:MAG: hypothetical protein AAFR01_10430 [Pseudomonadota bacterium]